MTKHFPGGGPQKDGEDPHFPYGKEQVYPGNNFDYHLRPFEAAFAANTVAMAAMLYHQATGDAWGHKFFDELMAAGLPRYQQRATGPKLHDMFPECLVYAWELTGDVAWLRDTLWHLRLLFRGYGSVGWLPESNEPLDAKAFARLYRGLAPYLGACARAGLLAAVEAELYDGPGARPAPRGATRAARPAAPTAPAKRPPRRRSR